MEGEQKTPPQSEELPEPLSTELKFQQKWAIWEHWTSSGES